MPRSTEFPHNKKQAAKQVAKLKAQEKKKPKPKAKANYKGKAKAKPKPEAAKTMTDAQIAALKRAAVKKVNTQVTKLPTKKGAKSKYKSY